MMGDVLKQYGDVTITPRSSVVSVLFASRRSLRVSRLQQNLNRIDSMTTQPRVGVRTLSARRCARPAKTVLKPPF